MFEIGLLLVTCKQKTTNTYICQFLVSFSESAHSITLYIYIYYLFVIVVCIQLLEVASPARAWAVPGFGPEYVGPGRASGRKVLIASGLVGPGLPCAFEFRLIYTSPSVSVASRRITLLQRPLRDLCSLGFGATRLKETTKNIIFEISMLDYPIWSLESS